MVRRSKKQVAQAIRPVRYHLGVAVLLIGVCAVLALLSMGEISRDPTGALVKTEIAKRCNAEYRSCGEPCRLKTSVARRVCVAPCVSAYKRCRDTAKYVVPWVWDQQ